MQVCEEDVPGFEQLDFLLLRFLDLHNHVGGLEHRLGVGENFRTGLFVGTVGAVDPVTGACLHQHLMPGGDELGH